MSHAQVINPNPVDPVNPQPASSQGSSNSDSILDIELMLLLTKELQELIPCMVEQGEEANKNNSNPPPAPTTPASTYLFLENEQDALKKTLMEQLNKTLQANPSLLKGSSLFSSTLTSGNLKQDVKQVLTDLFSHIAKDIKEKGSQDGKADPFQQEIHTLVTTLLAKEEQPTLHNAKAHGKHHATKTDGSNPTDPSNPPVVTHKEVKELLDGMKKVDHIITQAKQADTPEKQQAVVKALTALISMLYTLLSTIMNGIKDNNERLSNLGDNLLKSLAEELPLLIQKIEDMLAEAQKQSFWQSFMQALNITLGIILLIAAVVLEQPELLVLAAACFVFASPAGQKWMDSMVKWLTPLIGEKAARVVAAIIVIIVITFFTMGVGAGDASLEAGGEAGAESGADAGADATLDSLADDGGEELEMTTMSSDGASGAGGASESSGTAATSDISDVSDEVDTATDDAAESNASTTSSEASNTSKVASTTSKVGTRSSQFWSRMGSCARMGFFNGAIFGNLVPSLMDVIDDKDKNNPVYIAVEIIVTIILAGLGGPSDGAAPAEGADAAGSAAKGATAFQRLAKAIQGFIGPEATEMLRTAGKVTKEVIITMAQDIVQILMIVGEGNLASTFKDQADTKASEAPIEKAQTLLQAALAGLDQEKTLNNKSGQEQEQPIAQLLGGMGKLLSAEDVAPQALMG